MTNNLKLATKQHTKSKQLAAPPSHSLRAPRVRGPLVDKHCFRTCYFVSLHITVDSLVYRRKTKQQGRMLRPAVAATETEENHEMSQDRIAALCIKIRSRGQPYTKPGNPGCRRVNSYTVTCNRKTMNPMKPKLV